jgi:TetR/AcrR family transcriptional regulator, mexJK operon transcriptional repressor
MGPHIMGSHLSLITHHRLNHITHHRLSLIMPRRLRLTTPRLRLTMPHLRRQDTTHHRRATPMRRDIHRAITVRAENVPTAGKPRPRRKRTALRRGGRPSSADAARLSETILDVATELILTEGYGVTSIEAIARRAHISKRTFYSRYKDKAELFAAVVHRVVERLRPQDDASLFEGGTIEEILTRSAQVILRAALSSQALALYRVILAEATRFPELAKVVSEQRGRNEAITRIAALLEGEAHAGHIVLDNTSFAAAQFLQMVVSLPQRRSLGLGTPMTPAELERWARDTVTLFLNGCRARRN